MSGAAPFDQVGGHALVEGEVELPSVDVVPAALQRDGDGGEVYAGIGFHALQVYRGAVPMLMILPSSPGRLVSPPIVWRLSRTVTW